MTDGTYNWVLVEYEVVFFPTLTEYMAMNFWIPTLVELNVKDPKPVLSTVTEAFVEPVTAIEAPAAA